MNSEHSVNYEPFTFADDLEWPTDRLQTHTKLLLQAKENANPRKGAELGHEIGHAAFELAMRDLERKTLEEKLGAAAVA